MTRRWFSIGTLIVLGCLLGWLGFALWGQHSVAAERVAWSPEVRWVGTPEPSYRLYGRTTFDLPGDRARAGWLRISADNNFVLYFNGEQVGRQLTHVSSSLPFADRNTLANQELNDSASYEVRTINTNVSYFHNWKHTFYVDLTPLLKSGRNVLAVDVMKAQQNPRVVIEGAVDLYDGAPPINLSTGVAEWKVSTLAESRQWVQWWQPDFSDLDWAIAPTLGSVQESTYSRISPHLFARPFQPQRITGTESDLGEMWLTQRWQLPNSYERAYLRFAGDGDLSVLLNDQLVSRTIPDEDRRPLLNLYDVTHLLHPGENVLWVRQSRSLSRDRTLDRAGPLGLSLDAWAETAQGEVVAPFSSDDTWNTQATSAADALTQPAIPLAIPDPRTYRRTFWGTTRLYDYPGYLGQQFAWLWLGLTLAFGYAYWLGRFWWQNAATAAASDVTTPEHPVYDSLQKGAVLLFPGLLFLLGIGLLKSRYAESEQGLLFARPYSNSLILLAFLGIVLATLLWSRRSELKAWVYRGFWFLLALWLAVGIGLAVSGWVWLAVWLVGGAIAASLILVVSQSRQSTLATTLITGSTLIRATWTTWGKWALLGLIISGNFILNIYDLSFTPRDSDENTSLNAIDGILRTGAPIMPSEIWYTRSPVYHYLVALWLRIAGDAYENARFVSAVFATATLILAFIFARKLTGKFWLALAIAAVLAIDPWQLMNARNVRFYQMLAFLSLLSFWSFYRGFIEREGRVYQYIFLVALTLALVTQEGVAPTLIPGFIFGLLCFYRPFSWRQDWQIILGAAVGLALYVYDVVFFMLKCLTPSVGISSGTSVPLGLHFFNVTGFISTFLVGNSRMNLLYALFFVLGLIDCLRRRNGKMAFLFASVLIQLLSLTLLVSQVFSRYTYLIYPLFIILSIYGLFYVIESVIEQSQESFKFQWLTAHGDFVPVRGILLAGAALLLFSNLEPHRMFASYADKLSRNNPVVFEYIQQHWQAGDVVVAGNPPAAGQVLGSLDYFLSPRLTLSFDGLYLREGELVDRWAGGRAIADLGQLENLLQHSGRVWIQVDDNPFPENPRQLQFYEYVRNLGKPTFETYGVRLRLWQPSDGLLPRLTTPVS